MEKEDKKMEREAVFIEIDWENQEDLIELSKSPKFKDFVLKESYKAIVYALKNNLPKAELFNIFNLSVIVEINRSQFKKPLKKMMQMLIEEERYEACNKLKKLIEKYEL
jgi:hypothetical protein|tara:strand:- start:1259 stop:1585 length:327 start_codon:yes stop_codon:yes gene_type:complete